MHLYQETRQKATRHQATRHQATRHRTRKFAILLLLVLSATGSAAGVFCSPVAGVFCATAAGVFCAPAAGALSSRIEWPAIRCGSGGALPAHITHPTAAGDLRADITYPNGAWYGVWHGAWLAAWPPANGSDTAYCFMVAGHAYGAHEGGNKGLHPAFLGSLETGYDPLTAFLVLTGDIVNESTAESWQQVETELSGYPFPAFYVMGNHDNNDIGHQEFEDKFGAAYYAFRRQRDLFVVLNSTEADRSIPAGQLEFLEEQILQAGDSTRNVFVFFHEILWNSNEKYRDVRSNSRSRYDQMVGYSNYWEDVHPLFAGDTGRQYYVIAGDMGGNPDAMAAFYDRWDNVTLLASGMGEVPDENYLLVRVHGDMHVEFELVPLNGAPDLPGIEYYSVPPSPGPVEGPDEVEPGSTGVEYGVPEVFNATSYLWELPAGLSGSGASNRIYVDVDPSFTEGTISVRAGRNGFGTGPAASKNIKSAATAVAITETGGNLLPIELHRAAECLVVRVRGHGGELLHVRVFDSLGRLVRTQSCRIEGDSFALSFPNHELPEGLILISLSTNSGRHLYRGKIRF
jgi:hypothetical protein